MKKILNYWLLFILLITLYSCGANRVISIEVREPAKISLPPEISRVIIVNNTLPQPNDAGSLLRIDSVTVEMNKLDLEPFASILTNVLQNEMIELQYFDEVALYMDTVRKDNEWLIEKPLPQELKNYIFDEEEYDAIISLNKVLIKSREDIRNNSPHNPIHCGSVPKSEQTYNYTSAHIDIKAEAIITCNLHLFNRNNPLKPFVLTDSISFKESVEADTNFMFQTLPNALLTELAVNMGQNLAYYFCPYWDTQERNIYSSLNARMKEASSFASNNKWDRAAEIWTNEYNKSKNNTLKSELACNIALSHEMSDRLDKALEWVRIADKLADSKDSYISSYIKALENRINGNRLLDMQIGAPAE